MHTRFEVQLQGDKKLSRFQLQRQQTKTKEWFFLIPRSKHFWDQGLVVIVFHALLFPVHLFRGVSPKTNITMT